MLLSIISMETINSSESLDSFIYSAIEQLNLETQVNLDLTKAEMEIIKEFNQTYWLSRKQILDTPNTLMIDTHLLICWDHWRISLEENLSEAQMKRFLDWQTEIDLLSKNPDAILGFEF